MRQYNSTKRHKGRDLIRKAEYGKARYRRIHGFDKLDKVTYPPHVKGRQAERTAQAFMIKAGCEDVRLIGGSFNPDLTFMESGVLKRVEVKTACNVPRTKNAWITYPVSSARESDDYVIIVFPDDSVLMCTMAEHLAACDAGGNRRVSLLVWHRCPDLRVPRTRYSIDPELKRRPRPRTSRKHARDEIIEILKARGEWPLAS